MNRSSTEIKENTTTSIHYKSCFKKEYHIYIYTEEELAQLYEEIGHLFSIIDITRLQTIPNIVIVLSNLLAAEVLIT